jgi:hypothetical protein
MADKYLVWESKAKDGKYTRFFITDGEVAENIVAEFPVGIRGVDDQRALANNTASYMNTIYQAMKQLYKNTEIK